VSGLAVVNGIGHVNNVKPRRARLVLGFWHVYHFTVFQATQRGNLSVGRHSEYWKWFRPTLGKKRRVVRSSRPCCQDSWHAGTSLIWSNARRITGQMGWAPSRPDLSVYEWIFLALYQVKQWDKIETCVTEARQPLALMEDICCLKMTLTTTQPIVLCLELYAHCCIWSWKWCFCWQKSNILTVHKFYHLQLHKSNLNCTFFTAKASISSFSETCLLTPNSCYKRIKFWLLMKT